MALVRFNRSRVEKPTRITTGTQLHEEPFLLCFRPDELAGRWQDAWRALADQGRALDGGLLARIVFPTNTSHEPAALANHFGTTSTWSSGAERAAATAEVAQHLLTTLHAQPLAVLLEMEKLLKPLSHPLGELVVEAAREAVRKGFGVKQRTVSDLLHGEAVPVSRKARAPAKDPPVPLDVERVCRVFSPEGALAQNHRAYEFRPEQVRMVKEVCEAFNDSLVLMVEAGAGTGKSMAYLVPSIIWSVANDDPVIVSTNTKNLQAQLFKKDLPFLEHALEERFRYALIKGRANYLCRRKFLMVLCGADRELSDSNRIEILPVLTWLPKTGTGDVAEIAGFKPGMASDLWSMISTRPDECVGPRCRYWRRCFVRRARALAQQADVVIANHATVFSEGSGQSAVLPEHRCIVFDEAHNLEDVATNCLAITVASWQVPRILNRLFRGRRDGAGRGLFANLRFQLSKARSSVSPENASRISDEIATAVNRFVGVRQAGDATFSTLETLFAAADRRQGDRIRYDADHRPEDWPQVAQAISDYSDVISDLAEQVEKVATQTQSCAESDRAAEPLQDLLEVGAEVRAQTVQLRAMMQSLEFVLKAEDENYVYWAERGRDRRSASLCAAPLDIAELMNRIVYSRSRTAIFTSATLAAEQSFDFMRDRLGARGAVSERTRTTALGSSFDFPRQVFAAVPVFLPEPRAYGPDFVGPFSELAVSVLKATRGRGLVLFTSHNMLRRSARAMKAALVAEGIPVLAQGIDGGRERLMAVFAHETASVLLGTQSFWEGVDVPGESLTCLILAKLPFRPHTDPIVSARCDLLERRGGNPFMDYMVPDAVIRLKQGFGRLIRTRQDRGVVLICDPRVVTKRYGQAFRDSLPAAVRAFPRADALLDALRSFLG